MLSKLESVLMPLAEKIGKNKYLIAVRDGFLLSMPLLIVGSFFLLIANFPIPGWSDFWARFFGENWTSYFQANGRHLHDHGNPGCHRHRLFLCRADERG